ncbi:TonB-dependent receptor [Gluconacetobacter asukensis]|nr:TonB-dependent receptor [Gluconacetobacter asukensis]
MPPVNLIAPGGALPARTVRLPLRAALSTILCMGAPGVAAAAATPAPDTGTAASRPAHPAKARPNTATIHPPAATPPRPAESTSRLEAITVTADRRSQNAQNVPSSIAVITGRDLVARNVNTVFDLQYLTPSLQVTPQFGSGQPAFTIRGVGFNDYASNNAPTVGIYLDEVANPVPFASNGMMFDISRVEVLRGPQGTLYGRNTTGGAINYILNHPTDSFHAGLTGQYGRFDAGKVEGYLSGPVGRYIKVRLSGQTQQGGAWQHDDQGAHLGNVDRGAARLLVEAAPTDSMKVTLNIHGSRDRSDANGLHLYSPLRSLNILYGNAYPIYPADTDRDIAHWGTSPQFAREIGISPNAKPFSHIDTGGLSLRIDQDFAAFRLTELASYDAAARQEYDNYDASSLAIADVYYQSRANVFSNELRFTSRGPSRLSWVGGIYYSNQYLSDQYHSGFMNAYGFDRVVKYSQMVNTISGFGQATYRLLDKLSITGGLRIEHEARSLYDFQSYMLSGSDPGNAPFGPRQHYDYTKPSAKFAIQYIPIRNDMLYASYSHGIKSGGFTTYNTAAPQISTKPFKAETIDAWELGNKLDLPRQNLRLNLSSFYYDYHGQQIQSAVVNPQTGLVGSIVNAPHSHLYGLEFEAEWSPLPGLTLTQSGGWAIGQFDNFYSILRADRINGTYVGVYASRKGDSLPAPKLTLNGSAAYRWSMGDYTLTTSMNYSLRSTYRSLFGPLYNVAGYTLWGANLSFGPKNNRWTVAAFGNNIFNKRYDVERNYFVNGDTVALAGMPAIWGVRAAISY